MEGKLESMLTDSGGMWLPAPSHQEARKALGRRGFTPEPGAQPQALLGSAVPGARGPVLPFFFLSALGLRFWAC